jgi:hypothetical protein
MAPQKTDSGEKSVMTISKRVKGMRAIATQKTASREGFGPVHCKAFTKLFVTLEALEALLVEDGWPIPLTSLYLVNQPKMCHVLDQLRGALEDLEEQYLLAQRHEQYKESRDATLQSGSEKLNRGFDPKAAPPVLPRLKQGASVPSPVNPTHKTPIVPTTQPPKSTEMAAKAKTSAKSKKAPSKKSPHLSP